MFIDRFAIALLFNREILLVGSTMYIS